MTISVAACSLFAGLLTTPTTSVSVSILGVPEGVRPTLTIQTPAGQRVVTGTSRELADLQFAEPGTYRVTSAPFRAPNGLADVIYDPQPEQRVEVAAGQTATISFRFSQRPGTGLLWIASVRTADDDDFSQSTIRAFRLGSGQSPTTDRLWTVKTGPRSYGGVVLPNGILLFGDGWDVDRIVRFDTRRQGQGTVSPAGGSEHAMTARDPQGRIWLSRDDYARAYVPTADGGLGSPVVELKRDEQADDKPDLNVLIFRHDGSLVIQGGPGIAIIPAAELNRSHTVRPRWRSMPPGTRGRGAIDADGNLWFANEGGGVYRVSKEALDGSGPIEPDEFDIEFGLGAIVIDAEGGVLAFNRASGDLWRLPPGGSSFAKIGNLGTGFDHNSQPVLNPPAAGTPLAAGFPTRTD